MNTKLKTIFFDLDDTLYFRCDAFYQAFDAYFCDAEFYQSRGLTVTPGTAEYEELKKFANDRCRIRGDEVFYQSQRGIITMQEMYIYRFQTGFRDAGISLTENEALDFHSLYKNFLYNLKLNDDVVAMLEFCKKNFDRIGIITNGPSSHQRNKIKNLGLEPYLDPELIIVSGEYGVDKPDLKIFEIARQKTNCECSELIFVGDNFNNDIIPALSLGWHAVWLNLYDEDFSSPHESSEQDGLSSQTGLSSQCGSSSQDGLSGSAPTPVPDGEVKTVAQIPAVLKGLT